jgi:anti-sigma regulatory factor (Ser/Thr protein kinase)
VSGLDHVLALPQELGSVTKARHFVRDVLRSWDLADLVEDAELGTSELVANAVRHARTDLVLSVRVDGVVTVAIQDGEPELRRPVIADAGFLSENGRGLHIVAAISHDWGITTAANGKVVWFSMALPDGRDEDAEVVSLEDARNAAAADAEEADRPLRRREPAESAG